MQSAIQKTLRAAAKIAVDKVGTLMAEMPWENRDFYGCWLGQTFHLTSHSTRLLAAAAARVPLNASTFHIRFLDHAHEEKGHQILAARNLKALGLTIENHPEFAETAAFHRSQYYQIERGDPLVLFGYILFLEGLAATAGKEIHKRVEAAFGKEACTFLSLHANEDGDHVEEAYQKLDQISETQKECILQNIDHSAQMYATLLIKLSAQPMNRPSATAPMTEVAYS